MKKLLLLATVLSLLSFEASAQRAIIAGEQAAGVYVNIKTDASGNLFVTGTGASSNSFTQTAPTVTNSSGTLLAANTARKSLIIQNNDATGILYIGFVATATTAMLKIAPGASLFLTQNVPTNIVTAIGSIASNANVVLIEGN